VEHSLLRMLFFNFANQTVISQIYFSGTVNIKLFTDEIKIYFEITDVSAFPTFKKSIKVSMILPPWCQFYMDLCGLIQTINK